MPKSWRKESKPHKLCPGCGHGLALKAIGQAIDNLGIQGRTVYGCDIGCALLTWDFFDVDSVQTHHGRTTPVMVGIKRANPQAICIAYMGDGGGYAIGSQHLVNSAARDEQVTIFLINNTNYGMTGGQLAPTTLPGQKTDTTPYGRDVATTGHPLLGPEMVAAIAGEGAYVARATIDKPKQLLNFVTKAIQNQIAGRGINFVEIMSICPINWRKSTHDTWAYLREDMSKFFTAGELKVPEDLRS